MSIASMQAVGVILVISLLVGPALTAYLLVKELHQMMIVGLFWCDRQYRWCLPQLLLELLYLVWVHRTGVLQFVFCWHCYSARLKAF